MKVNNYIYINSETIKNNEDILNTNESTRYYEISLKGDNSLLMRVSRILCKLKI